MHTKILWGRLILYVENIKLYMFCKININTGYYHWNIYNELDANRNVMHIIDTQFCYLTKVDQARLLRNKEKTVKILKFTMDNMQVVTDN